MKSMSQVAQIQDCFETLDEAKEEIRILYAERATMRAKIKRLDGVAQEVLPLIEEIASYASVFAGDIGSRGPSQREAIVGDLRVRHVVQAEKILSLFS